MLSFSNTKWLLNEFENEQLFLQLCFDYKTIKGQVSLEGVGGGSRHPLVDTHLKRKKGFFSKGSIIWGGGGRTAYGVVFH